MPQEKWPLIMSKAFKKAIEREYDEKKTLPPLTRAEKLDIKSMLQAYLNEYREIDRPEHLCFEKSFEIRIAGFKVRGIADRVDRTKRGSLKIVDYKTSKYPMRATEAFESVQLPTYAIWARQAIEDCKVFGEYVYLRHLGTKAGHQTFKISDELIEDAIEKYAEVGEALSNGCKFVRNTTFKWCGNRCEFHDYCIKDEED
jgi:RecB family exonuclease